MKLGIQLDFLFPSCLSIALAIKDAWPVSWVKYPFVIVFFLFVFVLSCTYEACGTFLPYFYVLRENSTCFISLSKSTQVDGYFFSPMEVAPSWL